MIIRILFALLLVVSTIAPIHAIQPEPLMAVDIGSNSTRYTIADVHPQTGKIVRIVDSGHFDAAYQIDLISSTNRQFSPLMFERAIDVFQRLKSKYDYYGVSRSRVIAKQSFRLAGNSQELARQIQKKTGFVIKTLTYQEEDKLDYFTAQRASQDNAHPVVWDIAASSFQLIVEDESQEPFTHQGRFGSMDFLSYLLEVVQQKPSGQSNSLQQLSQNEFSAGIRFARFLARQTPASIKKKILENGSTVLAIGTLLRNSIGGGNRTAMTQGELLQTINKQLASVNHQSHPPKNQLDASDQFSHTRLANMVMVYGMMLELGINKLEIARGDASESLLKYPAYWQ